MAKEKKIGNVDLKQALGKVDTAKPIEKAKIAVKEVTLGVATVNDHEYRITMLEEKLKELTR